ncbi:hypothetical protein RUM43_006079 [Polyplax serrata]|uniref:Uncharacterized protein n=1 Tax=Polyplax serrata TaxID=468196 RepID=A0AAN8S3B2_POLSC
MTPRFGNGFSLGKNPEKLRGTGEMCGNTKSREVKVRQESGERQEQQQQRRQEQRDEMEGPRGRGKFNKVCC